MYDEANDFRPDSDDEPFSNRDDLNGYDPEAPVRHNGGEL